MPDPDSSSPSGSHAADQALIERVLQRDPPALESLIRRLSCVPRMLALKNRQHGRPLDDHDLEDLSQQTIQVIWKKLPSFQGRARLETWVFRVCYLEFLTALRARHRGLRLLGDETATLAGDVAQERQADHEGLLLALEELPASEEVVVRCKHLEGRTFEEIGEILGVSVNTAKTRYYRGILKLRRRLGAQRSLEARERQS